LGFGRGAATSERKGGCERGGQCARTALGWSLGVASDSLTDGRTNMSGLFLLGARTHAHRLLLESVKLPQGVIDVDVRDEMKDLFKLLSSSDFFFFFFLLSDSGFAVMQGRGLARSTRKDNLAQLCLFSSGRRHAGRSGRSGRDHVGIPSKEASAHRRGDGRSTPTTYRTSSPHRFVSVFPSALPTFSTASARPGFSEGVSCRRAVTGIRRRRALRRSSVGVVAACATRQRSISPRYSTTLISSRINLHR
jgi:hypothetical protein